MEDFKEYATFKTTNKEGEELELAVVDEFDVEKGKALAIARCAAKIAMKRQNRAKKCLAVAQARLEDAQRWVKKMTDYSTDAIQASQEAFDELYKIEQSYK